MRRLRLVLLAALAPLCAGEVAIASHDVSEHAVAERRLRGILLGSVTTWDDGTPILVVLVDEPGATAALKEVTGRDLAQLLRGWKRLVYAGSGAMPVVTRSTREALDEVRRRSGAIVLLSADPRAADLQTVLEVQRTDPERGAKD
jgi:hypothetical protein